MQSVTRSGLVLGTIGAVVTVLVAVALVSALQPPEEFDRGNRMMVTVEITEGWASSLFLGESSTLQETLVLERVGAVWLIAEAPWPIYCWEA